MRIALLFSLGVGFLSLGLAQKPYEPSERLKTIQTNMRQLEVSFTLDRTEYLSGEDPKATIRVRNPTNHAMEIYIPFHNIETSSIVLQSKSKYNLETWGSEWWRVGHEPSRVFIQGSGENILPTTTIETGAELHVELYLDGDLGIDAPVYFNNFVMLPEGDYRFGYSGGGGWVEFHVVQPRRVSYRKFDRRPLQSMQARALPTPPHYLAVLGTTEEEVLVIPVNPSIIENPKTEADGRLSTFWLQTFAPFVRVATSKSGFAAYDLHEERDRVVVDWESRDGTHGSARLDNTELVHEGKSFSVLRPSKN